MQNNVTEQIKSRNLAYQQVKGIEKKIRYLQRELVRASFQGSEKTGLCRKLLKVIESERTKIRRLDASKSMNSLS